MASVTIINKFAKVREMMDLALQISDTEIGELIATEAQANMYPGHAYDTGEMHDHTVYEKLDATHGQVHVDVPYAAYPEYGTRNMAARPFLTPAIQKIWPQELGRSMIRNVQNDK